MALINGLNIRGGISGSRIITHQCVFLTKEQEK